MRVAMLLLALLHAAAATGFYDILGVSKTATKKEIKKAFRNLALKYHPDRNPSPDAQTEFIRLANAYETLTDADRRRQYDSNPHAFHPPPPPPGSPPSPPSPGDHAPPPDFDYTAFFKKFDEALRKHAEAHVAALGGDTEQAAHVAAHMQDHMKLHLQAQADAQAAIRMAHGHPPQPNPEHERAKYNRPRLAIDVDELFEDMDSDEFERLKKASGDSGPRCTSRSIKKDGVVTTTTECTDD